MRPTSGAVESAVIRSPTLDRNASYSASSSYSFSAFWGKAQAEPEPEYEDDDEEDFHRSHPCSCGPPQRIKMFKPFPSREGQGPSGPGVGCGVENGPTPALRATPPTEGIFIGVFGPVASRPWKWSAMRGYAKVSLEKTSRNCQRVRGCLVGLHERGTTTP